MFRNAFTFFKMAKHEDIKFTAYAIGYVAYIAALIGAYLKDEQRKLEEFQRRHPNVRPDIEYSVVGSRGLQSKYVIPKKNLDQEKPDDTIKWTSGPAL